MKITQEAISIFGIHADNLGLSLEELAALHNNLGKSTRPVTSARNNMGFELMSVTPTHITLSVTRRTYGSQQIKHVETWQVPFNTLCYMYEPDNYCQVARYIKQALEALITLEP
jgi:hypothetical protein